MYSTRSAVFGKVKVELRTRGGVMEKSPFGRGSPPCTARVEGPSVSSLTGGLGGRGHAGVDGPADRVELGGELHGEVGVARRHIGQLPTVVAHLELGELEAVGGGDHDDPLVGGDGPSLLQLDE